MGKGCGAYLAEALVGAQVALAVGTGVVDVLAVLHDEGDAAEAPGDQQDEAATLGMRQKKGQKKGVGTRQRRGSRR